MGPDTPLFQNAPAKRSQFISIKRALDPVQPEHPLPAAPPDDEDIPFHTYSLQAVTQIESKIQAKAFFAQLILLLVSIVFLEALVVLFIALSDPTYRIGVAIVFVITCSYVASGQMKFLDQARQQNILTATTVTRAVKKPAAAEHDDMMQHLKLLKKDTMLYLRSLNKKDLKKGL